MDTVLTLEPADGTDVPLYVRIGRALVAEIVRGRLRPGARLPGSRSLAASLGVHRNTVLAAYAELVAEGWLAAQPSGGTFVSAHLPERAPKRFSSAAPLRASVPARPAFALGDDGGRGETFDFERSRLASAVPDVRLVPRELLARAVRRVLKRKPGLLDYGDAFGEPALRHAVAQLGTAQRGLCAHADDVLITQGSQMALDLVARALVRPGDVVAVEALSYGPAREAFRRAGAQLLAVPVDARGMVVSKLEGRGVRLVYVTPHHQYPTTVTLAPERRLALLALARRERFAIVEDDYDYEFHYEGRPVLPLASADTAGSVIYVGTLSKLLAPALRIGFVVAPRPLLGRLAALRSHADRHGDRVLQAAVAELIEDGELARHARRMRTVYQLRRDTFVDALERRLGGAIELTRPAGGMAVWFDAAANLDVDAWSSRCAAHGLAFPTTRVFAVGAVDRAGGRWAFASSTEAELLAVSAVLARTCPERPARGRPRRL